MTKLLTKAQLENKEKKFRELFEKFGITGVSIDYFMRGQISVEFVSRRLRAMKKAGVPLTGILYKMKLPPNDFDTLIQRYKSGHKFSKAQQDLFDYLKAKGISEEVAVKLASHRFPTRLKLPEKIAFFEGIKLDFAHFGTERIPVSVYEKYLHNELGEIKKRLVKTVLKEVADQHARRQLNVIFPQYKTEPRLAKVAPHILYLRFLIGATKDMRITTNFLATKPLKQRKLSSARKGKRKVQYLTDL